jgi:hypothetical protein
MPAASQDDRRQPRRLHPEDRRPGEEPRHAGHRRPRPCAEPPVLVAEPQAIGDRLAGGKTPDVPGPGRLHPDEPTLDAGQRPGHVRLVNLAPVEDSVRTTSDREVVPRQPRDGPGVPPAMLQERSILAEEDGPIDGRVPQDRRDRSRRPPDARVAKRRDPRPGPAGAEDARVFREGHHRGRRPFEPQPAEPRDPRPGRRDDPADIPNRPVGRQRGRNPVARCRDDDLDPPRPLLARQRGECPRDRPGRIAGRDDYAQDGGGRETWPRRPIQLCPGSRPARKGSRSSRRRLRP